MAETEKSTIWIKFGLRFFRTGLKEESRRIRVGSKIDVKKGTELVGLDKWRSTVKGKLIIWGIQYSCPDNGVTNEEKKQMFSEKVLSQLETVIRDWELET